MIIGLFVMQVLEELRVKIVFGTKMINQNRAVEKMTKEIKRFELQCCLVVGFRDVDIN
jgi:hypothetical protein